MKFLLVTYNDSDGVGQTVVNLNSALNKLGHNSKIILLNKTYNFDNVFKIERSLFKRIFYYFFEFLKKRYSDLFSFGNSTINFSLLNKYLDDADIVIIYTLHKFISLKMLNEIKKKKIVFLRPLDMELATGGCHVNFLYENGEECKKYLRGCNDCPKLNYLNIFNISNKIFENKKRFINQFKPKILLENKYTKSYYDKSPITQNTTNEVVHLAVRDSRKKIVEKNVARKLFEFNSNEKILLFGTYNLDAPHKGGRILGEILSLFADSCNRLNKSYLKNNTIRLVTFGRKQNFNIKVKNIIWTHLKEISGDKKLNYLYRSADVFLSPSTGCNAPSTIRESVVNDLPVIAFDNGEASETIIDNVNGYLIEKFDKQKFAEAIFKTLFEKKFEDKQNWAEFLKKRYDVKNEAELIVEKAKKDFSKLS